jgi:hypothetical protein
MHVDTDIAVAILDVIVGQSVIYVCARACLPSLQIGKSGASWITQAFLLGTGSIAAAMPFTGVIFAGVCLVWIQVCRQGMCVHAELHCLSPAERVHASHCNISTMDSQTSGFIKCVQHGVGVMQHCWLPF